MMVYRFDKSLRQFEEMFVCQACTAIEEQRQEALASLQLMAREVDAQLSLRISEVPLRLLRSLKRLFCEVHQSLQAEFKAKRLHFLYFSHVFKVADATLHTEVATAAASEACNALRDCESESKVICRQMIDTTWAWRWNDYALTWARLGKV